ncbi:MAG: MCE family protein [Bdellovibrionaceae bacterium]|jgi:phospholipid/cholesterol/gamma-HCH transport system substrate-binding protein|nr:MCE family protein [Pseudobdellovibrionaceae bacterium]
MKIKFNKFERVAGIFVGFALLGVVVSTAGIAVKKGWFSSKVSFQTKLESAEGIHVGTRVQIAGLRAGMVESVDLISNNEVLIHFEILEKFHKRVRDDSELIVVRPFVIGEKVIDITVGSASAKILPKGSNIISKPSFDIMDLVSGRKLGPFMNNLEGVMVNLKTLAHAFTDKRRTEAMVKMFDRLDPLLKNMDHMAKQIIRVTKPLTKKKNMKLLVDNLAKIIYEINLFLPEFRKNMPNSAQQMAELIKNMNIMVGALAPALETVGSDLPQASLRALEALDEAVVLLKAMQKTFLLSGKVDDVRNEEKKKRKPAGGK